MASNEKQKQLKSQIQEAADVLKSVAHGPSLAIGIDLDECLDEAPDFFRTLPHHWLAPVYVITFRRDMEQAKRDVESFCIRCTEIVLMSSFEQKAKEVADRGVFAYFDDQDEVLMHLHTAPRERVQN